MSECRTLEDALDATYDHLDILSPRNVAAFWTVAPQLLLRRRKMGQGEKISQRNGGQIEQQQMFQKFDTILVRTVEDIESFGFRDLTQTTLGLAKIMKKIGTRRRRSGPNQALNDLLIGQKA